MTALSPATTTVPPEWFIDPCKPWLGVPRKVSSECILPEAALSNVLQIIESTPPEDMSRRAYFPSVMISCKYCQTPKARKVFEIKKAMKRDATGLFCDQSCSRQWLNEREGKTGPNCNVCGVKIRKGKRQCSDACRLVAADRIREAMRSKLPDRQCEQCSKVYRAPGTTQGIRYCSQTCASRGRSIEVRGPANPMWRGGVDSKRYKLLN